MICTLLLEHVQVAVHESEGKQAEQVRVRPGETVDKKIRSTMGEELLVEWFEEMRHRLKLSYPLYRIHVQDAGGREAWRIKFEPIVGSSRYNGSDITLPVQYFLVYAADCQFSRKLIQPCPAYSDNYCIA